MKGVEVIEKASSDGVDLVVRKINSYDVAVVGEQSSGERMQLVVSEGHGLQRWQCFKGISMNFSDPVVVQGQDS